MDKVIVSGKIVLGNHFSQVQNFHRGRLMEPNMKKKYLTQQISLSMTEELINYTFFTSLHLFIMAELTLTTLLHRWQWFAFASQRHQTTNHLWHPIDSLFAVVVFNLWVDICVLYAEQMQWRERSFKPQLCSRCVASCNCIFWWRPSLRAAINEG